MARYRVWHEDVFMRADKVADACFWMGVPRDRLCPDPPDRGGIQRVNLAPFVEALDEEESLQRFFEMFAAPGSKVDFEVDYDNGYAYYVSCWRGSRQAHYAGMGPESIFKANFGVMHRSESRDIEAMLAL